MVDMVPCTAVRTNMSSDVLLLHSVGVGGCYSMEPGEDGEIKVVESFPQDRHSFSATQDMRF